MSNTSSQPSPSLAFATATPCRHTRLHSSVPVRVSRKPRVPVAALRDSGGSSAADGGALHKPSSDWRTFRAHLLRSHHLSVTPHLHTGLSGTSDEEHASLWAHRLLLPEVGACLVASPHHKWPDSFAHLRNAVILLTHVSSHKASGLLLNRRTALTVGQHKSVLARTGVEFADNPLMLGGDCSTGSLDVLHHLASHDCPGAETIVDGISRGGFNAARKLVRDGLVPARRFSFFVAYSKWTADSLQAELDRHAWDILACSPGLLLPSSPPSEPAQDLWHTLRAYL